MPHRALVCPPRRFPNHLVVNAEVVMNQPVSHASNIAPVHFGVSCPNGTRNLFRCFTDDFKASGKGSLQVLVVQEILIRDRPGTLYEVDALIEDMRISSKESRMLSSQKHNFLKNVFADMPFQSPFHYKIHLRTQKEGTSSKSTRISTSLSGRCSPLT